MDPQASRDLTSLRPGISHYSRLPVQRRVMQLVYSIKIRRSIYFKLIFGSYYFCFVQFSLFPPKRKRGITRDVASRREAIRKRERRVVETEEERSRRLSTMAQRGQDRKAEETEEQKIADCQTWHNVGRRGEPRKQKNKEIDDWQ
ncbi:hypothetical protein AVEN_202410-1 [Araneus ventricosus]|uniref:Uncharacterized protein n=1 Tax=Araneus ventricosus TaxID=182803 RepID=A0A4Y2FAY6_ARAVE|nr:hypothetical protein AVEN_202410-1 [Araneus ventricosus]